MKNFSIEIHGVGFHVPTATGGTTEGFVVMAFVEAENESDACDFALRTVIGAEDFHIRIGCHADPDRAQVWAEQWYELASFEGCKLPHGDFVFFSSEAPLQ